MPNLVSAQSGIVTAVRNISKANAQRALNQRKGSDSERRAEELSTGWLGVFKLKIVKCSVKLWIKVCKSMIKRKKNKLPVPETPNFGS